jgi:F-type H+-transporting ATPase subunit alpha
MSKKQLSNFLDSIESMLSQDSAVVAGDKSLGRIESYKDGVIEITGLPSLRMGELVSVDGLGVGVLILNLEKDRAYGLVLQPTTKIKEGMFIESSGAKLSMPVGENMIGRVVDSLGTPLDDLGDIKNTETRDHERIAPGVMTRKSVHQPLQTGIIAIDALVPIGRGQRELIIGDRQTGKTSLALDTIINQKSEDVICIYVSVAQREGKLRQVYETLKANGAMEYTTIVSAPASTSASMQFLAPYAGVALAEYFCEKGHDVLIVFDDLSKQAVAYREMSLLLRRPPGREAYPGDVFYIHSRLLERSVKLNEKYGSGSITALPIIETQAGDVSAYIPTNVISITDGQIFLETNLFNKGIRPAINVGLSVSRVGGAAQTKIMKKVSGTVKLDLAQYYELEAFSQFASDLDVQTKKSLARGSSVVEALKQKERNPYAVWQQVVVLFASTGGYFDSLEKTQIGEKIEYLFDQMEKHASDLVEQISDKKELTDDIKAGLKKHIDKILS